MVELDNPAIGYSEPAESPYGIASRLQFVRNTIIEWSKAAKPHRPLRILDVGCGTGELLTIPLGTLGFSILGIDPHQPSIEEARKRNRFPNVEFRCIAPEDLPAESFPIIICSEVLEHLPDPASILRAIHRLLMPDGWLVLTIPNGYGPFELETALHKRLQAWGVNKAVKRWLGAQTVEVSPPGTMNEECPHVQFFTFPRFKNLVESSGFIIQRRQNRSLFCGPISDRILVRSRRLINWNALVCRFLPMMLASSWMFLAIKRPCSEINTEPNCFVGKRDSQ